MPKVVQLHAITLMWRKTAQKADISQMSIVFFRGYRYQSILYIHISYPIGSDPCNYGIYGNIYHQYTPNVSIYIPYMDPMGIHISYMVL